MSVFKNTEPYTQILTLNQFQRAMGCSSAIAQAWHPMMDRAMHVYLITSVPRIAAFIATVSYESIALTSLVENLNYSSAKRLVEVWPNRFYLGKPLSGRRNASDFVNRPVAVAEYAYGARMGNGSEGSGDGWKYRGRGPGHTTGKANYLLLEREFGVPFSENPDLILEPKWGALTTAWLWADMGCNEFADGGKFDQVCYRWNGGPTGIEDRKATHDRIARYLAEVL